MNFNFWNDKDKCTKWFFRLFFIFLIIAGPGLTIFVLYLLKNSFL